MVVHRSGAESLALLPAADSADMGIALVAAVTPDAVADLNLVPGASVVFAFKAASVRVF